MPRKQVYLPDDLCQEVKRRGMRVSELLQKAIRAELEHEEKLEALDRYLEELFAEVGEPTEADRAEAKAFVDRLHRRSRQAS